MAEHDPLNADPVAEAFRASGPRISRRFFARRSSTWLLAGGAVAVLTACGGSAAASKEDLAALRKEIASIKRGGDEKADAHGATGATGATGAPGAHDAKHWAYEGAGGPEQWATLAPERCAPRAPRNRRSISPRRRPEQGGARTSSGSPPR